MKKGINFEIYFLYVFRLTVWEPLDTSWNDLVVGLLLPSLYVQKLTLTVPDLTKKISNNLLDGTTSWAVRRGSQAAMGMGFRMGWSPCSKWKLKIVRMAIWIWIVKNKCWVSFISIDTVPPARPLFFYLLRLLQISAFTQCVLHFFRYRFSSSSPRWWVCDRVFVPLSRHLRRNCLIWLLGELSCRHWRSKARRNFTQLADK